MKKLFLVVVLFLGIAVVVLSFGELETILFTLRKAHLGYFLLAILIQMAWLLTTGRMYKSVYRLLGLDESILALSRIAAAANFINIVAPTAGMGGVALFAAEARRRGHPAGRVTVAAALFLSLDHAAFLCVLALGLLVLVRRNDLDASEISASLFMLGIAVSYAFILYLGYRSEQKLGNLLAKMVRFINGIVRPFLKREYLSEIRAREFAHEVAEGFSGLTGRPAVLVRPILWGLLDKILLMCILVCSFLSFEVPFSTGTIIAGFSIAYLFLIVSPTPSGIGVVEGLMPVALSSLNVNWSQAVVITIAYRTVTFWVPFGLGAWAFRSLHSAGEEP
ncbi:MAG TPA: lysylphosphatidylglycerol synthase transmembrane domain-containing protein [Anaerolineales bacterium]|nr:lysylphosphatidylglycerol synthase transmembrane domain-containing protein [Anaerolineales bacterium]HND92839.1 lysylphosphatidylglycerol synthase transmembrane domain-containing protein [Anaerolineales bacterium]HNE68361.1 lysylphosphatidylglycerol synthase transmembrane domain-containing protein [Anaerolineales bacterium]HNF35039.1 lysylphosphatidylglycerol synthase transmembrane domain-containing protein [Anaerolineales bacterium]HNH79428.1 lysylphosphatidylglycerol synthase transmembrane